MSPDLYISDLVRDLLLTALLLAGPVLLVGLVVGVAVSLFQTLSLVPKMLAVLMVVLLLLAPALQVIRDYAERVFGQLIEFGLS
jgi:flagellar biosynthetic protein FliQ